MAEMDDKALQSGKATAEISEGFSFAYTRCKSAKRPTVLRHPTSRRWRRSSEGSHWRVIFRKWANQSRIAERKKMTSRKHDLPLVQQGKALKTNPTTIYCVPKPVNQEQLDLMNLIDTIHLDEPSGDVRKVRQYLTDSGVPIGCRHCNMIIRQLGIYGICRKPRMTVEHIGHKIYPYLLRHMEISKPNLAWAMDSTYNPMAKGFVYPACVIDIYSRKILSSVISNTLDARFCVEAYEEAVSLFGSREMINTDQGSQFTSDAFVTAVASSGARLSMDGKGAWTENIFIERLRRSRKYEEVYLKAYNTVADAKRWIYRYIERYNTIRPHSSLGGKTPDKIHKTNKAEHLLKAS